MQKIEEILDYLKSEEANIQLISKKTGISSDRLYSWRRGTGKPKAEDSKILEEWFKKIRNPSRYSPEKSEIDLVEYDMGNGVKKIEALSHVMLSAIAELLAKQNGSSATVVRGQLEKMVDDMLKS